jgi:hypothetical protein
MSRTRIAAEIAFALLCVVACWPLWATPWLPLQDLPQHLAAIRVLHDYNDPALGFASFFQLTPLKTQYIGFYSLAGALAWVMSVESATRLLLTIALIALPYAMRLLLRALGRPEALAVLALPLAYNANLGLGFLNFIAALPLMVAGLAIAAQQRGAPTRRGAAVYGLVAFGCFLMHVLPFGVLLIGSGLLALVPDVRGTARRLAPMAPPLALMALWSAVSQAGGATTSIVRAAANHLLGRPVEPVASFITWGAALRQLPDWLLDIVHAPAEDTVAVLFFALLLTALVWPQRAAAQTQEAPQEVPADAAWPHAAIALTMGACAGLYLVLPQGYDWVWPIAPRFALIAALLLIPLLRVPRGWPLGVVCTLCAALVLWQASVITTSFKAFQREEVADFAEAVEAIPQGARVAGLIFDRGSANIRFVPFIHSVARVQAERGGAVMFTFADFPQSPFRFREDMRPPRVPPRWEWTPERVDATRDLGWYSHVLTRGGPGSIAHQATYEPVYRGKRWAVWRRK